jgi:serine protease Do
MTRSTRNHDFYSDFDEKALAVSKADAAIPINSAKKCTGEMVRTGISSRPWLGIVGLSLTEELARYYDLPLDQGVLVTKVAEDSPAEHSGIVSGDTITRLENGAIHSIEDLLSEVHNRKVGDSVRISVFRNGREQTLEAILREIPQE